MPFIWYILRRLNKLRSIAVKRILVTTGMHGAGKTTIGTAIARQFDSQFFYEIGGILRQQTTETTLHSGPAFDIKIMEAEIARDAELVTCSSQLPVVETWHFGNLAYACLRNPDVFARYMRQTRKQLEVFEPMGLLFKVSRETFHKRRSEYVDPAELDKYVLFYEQLHQLTVALYEAYGVHYLELENEGSVQETRNRAMVFLAQSGIVPDA